MEAPSRSNSNLEVLVLVQGGKLKSLEKNPRSKARTNFKLNPHETLSTGIKPVSQRRESSTYPLQLKLCSPWKYSSVNFQKLHVWIDSHWLKNVVVSFELRLNMYGSQRIKYSVSEIYVKLVRYKTTKMWIIFIDLAGITKLSYWIIFLVINCCVQPQMT